MATVSSKELLSCLRLLKQVASKAAPRPILNKVRIHEIQGKLQFTATNLEMTVEVEVSCCNSVFLANGLVDLKDLWNVVSKAKGDIRFTLQPDRKNLEITMEGKFSLTSMIAINPDESDFPATPEWTFQTPAAEVESEVFHSALQQSMFAMARGDTRFAMNGILLAADKTGLVLAASDTHRLSVSEVSARVSKRGDLGIVPAAAAAMLDGILRRETGTVQIQLNGIKQMDEDGKEKVVWFMMFETPTVRLCTCLVEGQFPRYREVMPTPTQAHLTIMDRKAFLAALDALAGNVDPETHVLRLRRGQGSKVKLIGANASLETDAASNYGMIAMNMNIAYLQDALEAATGDSIVIQYGGDGSCPVSFTEGNWRHVIMPIRPGRENACICCGEAYHEPSNQEDLPEWLSRGYCSPECQQTIESEIGADWRMPMPVEEPQLAASA